MIFYILKARIGSIVSFLSNISLKTKMDTETESVAETTGQKEVHTIDPGK